MNSMHPADRFFARLFVVAVPCTTVFATCYVVGPSIDCCVPNDRYCENANTGWICTEEVVSGTAYSVGTIKLAKKGQSGWTDATSSSLGSCVREKRACGSLPGECVELDNVAFTCDSTTLGMLAENKCVGTSQN